MINYNLLLKINKYRYGTLMLYVHLLRGDVYIPGSHYRPIDMVAENKYVIKISRNTKFSET